MEQEPKANIRRQVPENDPEYREAMADHRMEHFGKAFGEVGLNVYDRAAGEIGRLTARAAELAASLKEPSELGEVRDNAVRAEIAVLEKKIESLDQAKGGALRREFGDLLLGASRLRIRGGMQRAKFVEAQVARMFPPPPQQEPKGPRKLFARRGKTVEPVDLYQKVLAGEISDEQLYAAATRHTEAFYEQEKALEGRVNELKGDFAAKVEEAAAAGALPESAVAALARLGETPVRLTDLMADVEQEAWGEANAGNVVLVSNEALQPELEGALRNVLFHEFLHVTSGRSSVVTAIENGDMPVVTAHERKSGLLLRPHAGAVGINRWLNEAVTESLAVRLTGRGDEEREGAYRGSEFYPNERRLLDGMYARGLEERTVYDAYFENISEDQPKGEKGAGYAALMRRIAEIEGPTGLAQIENQFAMNEVASVVLNAGASSADLAAEAPQGSRRVEIEVTIGNRPATEKGPGNEITRRFVADTEPAFGGAPAEDVASLMQSITRKLRAAEKACGRRLRFTVTEAAADSVAQAAE